MTAILVIAQFHLFLAMQPVVIWVTTGKSATQETKAPIVFSYLYLVNDGSIYTLYAQVSHLNAVNG